MRTIIAIAVVLGVVGVAVHAAWSAHSYARRQIPWLRGGFTNEEREAIDRGDFEATMALFMADRITLSEFMDSGTRRATRLIRRENVQHVYMVVLTASLIGAMWLRQ